MKMMQRSVTANQPPEGVTEPDNVLRFSERRRSQTSSPLRTTRFKSNPGSGCQGTWSHPATHTGAFGELSALL